VYLRNNTNKNDSPPFYVDFKFLHGCCYNVTPELFFLKLIFFKKIFVPLGQEVHESHFWAKGLDESQNVKRK
jgi:hypothetical protein